MKPQNSTPVSSIVSADLDAVIASNPENFDAVIFRAVAGDMETVAPSDDVVGSLEAAERRISYEPPTIVQALEPTLELGPYPILGSGGGYGLQQDGGVHRLLIAGRVPKQSVLAYPVAQHDGTYTLRIMYVLAADTLGRKAAAGYVYSLIPYVGGSEQVIEASPSYASIINHVAAILETITPPENINVPMPETLDDNDSEEIGML